MYDRFGSLKTSPLKIILNLLRRHRQAFYCKMIKDKLLILMNQNAIAKLTSFHLRVIKLVKYKTLIHDIVLRISRN